MGLDRHELESKAVLAAMSRVPRHLFVPQEYRDRAYEDSALPIDHGQTISQPFIVAFMTQETRVAKGSRVLEVGTGSGYQAAVLAELGAQVFSIEIIPELAKEAQARLGSLGYHQIQIRTGDGWSGWPEEMPFDAILVTAASPRPPLPLLGQLKDRGRLIVPVEHQDWEDLMLYERRGREFDSRNLGPVRFVPLCGTARQDPSENKVSSGFLH